MQLAPVSLDLFFLAMTEYFSDISRFGRQPFGDNSSVTMMTPLFSSSSLLISLGERTVRVIFLFDRNLESIHLSKTLSP
jgi:hypothetical protein